MFDRTAIRLAAIVSDGICDGSIRKLDPYIAAHGFMGMINGADELPFFVQGLTPEVAVNEFVRPLFEGLLNFK